MALPQTWSRFEHIKVKRYTNAPWKSIAYEVFSPSLHEFSKRHIGSNEFSAETKVNRSPHGKNRVKLSKKGEFRHHSSWWIISIHGQEKKGTNRKFDVYVPKIYWFTLINCMETLKPALAISKVTQVWNFKSLFLIDAHPSAFDVSFFGFSIQNKGLA